MLKLSWASLSPPCRFSCQKREWLYHLRNCWKVMPDAWARAWVQALSRDGSALSSVEWLSLSACGCKRRMSSMARAASASSGWSPRFCSSLQISWGPTVPSPSWSRLSKTRRTSISIRASLTKYHFLKSSKLILLSQLRLMLIAALAACLLSLQPRLCRSFSSSQSSMKPLPSASSLSNVSFKFPATCVTAAMPAVSRALAFSLSISTIPVRKAEGCVKWRLLLTEQSPAGIDISCAVPALSACTRRLANM
mmetsp:Transcript_123200/g.359732  ORF Transcript_123200/g.359732 Transcript_123200/m.359732 type:complete len:251 (-) Transcript_123200:574-1326(-)